MMTSSAEKHLIARSKIDKQSTISFLNGQFINKAIAAKPGACSNQL
jgi:hypothetical protein